MKQSKINNYFSPGKIRTGSSGYAMHFRGPRSYDNGTVGGKDSTRDIFHKLSDPVLIYEKIREREKRQMKLSAAPLAMESEMSSQNSTQMLLNSQNMESSQSMFANSSHSDDSSALYQQWINRPPSTGLYRPQQPDIKPFGRQNNMSRRPYTAKLSQDFNQCLENAQRKSKEKEERDMLNNLLASVKEYCDDAKTAVGKLDARCNEQSSASMEKMDEITRRFSGIQELLESKKEHAEKIINLEKQLDSVVTENQDLRRQLEEARNEADNKMLDKLTEAFDKGQQLQSDKMEELVLNTSNIKSILQKPKLHTSDMWCQYSPQVFSIHTKSRSSSSGSNASTHCSPARTDERIFTRAKENVVTCSTARRGQTDPMSGQKYVSHGMPISFSNAHSSAPEIQAMSSGNICSRDQYPFVKQTDLPPLPMRQQMLFDQSKQVEPYCTGINAVEQNSMNHFWNTTSDPRFSSGKFSPCGNGMDRHSTRKRPFTTEYPFWSKNKSSPIAAVIPQQRLTQGPAYVRQPPSYRAVVTSVTHELGNSANDGQSVQKFAESQSQVWFDRPRTRSRRSANFMDSSAASTSAGAAKRREPRSNIKENVRVQASPAAPPKKKTARRKRSGWVTKKKKKSTTKQPRSALSEEISNAELLNTSFSPDPGYTNDNRNASPPFVQDAPLSPKQFLRLPFVSCGELRDLKPSADIKQEVTDTIKCFYRQAPSSEIWPVDSDDESSSCEEHEKANLMSQNARANFHGNQAANTSNAFDFVVINGDREWFDM